MLPSWSLVSLAALCYALCCHQYGGHGRVHHCHLLVHNVQEAGWWVTGCTGVLWRTAWWGRRRRLRLELLLAGYARPVVGVAGCLKLVLALGAVALPATPYCRSQAAQALCDWRLLLG